MKIDFRRRDVSIPTWVLVLLTIGLSCTKAVQVPKTTYKGLDSKDGICFRISTKDDRVFETDDFRTTDSGLVIASTIEQSKRREIEPVNLSLDEIATIERIENTPTFYIALFAGATIVVAFASAISIMQSVHWGD